MPVSRDEIASFFQRYERRTNDALATPPTADLDASTAAFASCFVRANPHGVSCGQWHAFYRRKDGRELTLAFAVAYALQSRGGELRIFAFVTGDEQGEYAEHGLTPE
jgi:hypothetical protein